jgi:hypothetical protein
VRLFPTFTLKEPRNNFACIPEISTMGEGGYRQINKTLNACAFDDYLSMQQARLPKLADVEQLSPRVIRILGQNAGKVLASPSPTKNRSSYEHQPLTVFPVHTPRNKHLHCRYGFIETYHRHRSRHPPMGRYSSFPPQILIHHPVPRIPNPLARRSYWRGSRPSSPVSVPLHLYIQKRSR